MPTHSPFSKWLRYTLDDGLPKVGGVYALYWGGRVVYVGATSDLRMRMANHKYNKRRYDLIKFTLVDREGMILEDKLIRRLNPEGNKAKYGVLMKTPRNRMARAMRQETVTRTRHAKFIELYERLEMGRPASRNKPRAAVDQSKLPTVPEFNEILELLEEKRGQTAFETLLEELEKL